MADTIRALKGLMDERVGSGEVFNVGSTERIAIGELAERVLAATGSSSDTVFIPYDQVYGQGIEDMLHRIPATEKCGRRSVGAPSTTSRDPRGRDRPAAGLSRRVRPITRDMRISIFGLGYVGTVCAAALARSGFEVLGVDVNETKNAQINEGRSPIVEPGLEELIGEAVGAKRLSATSDHEQAVESSELSLICVGTPSRSNGSLDTSHVEDVARTIGGPPAQPRRQAYGRRPQHPPARGTTLGRVRPLLDEASGKRCGDQIGLRMGDKVIINIRAFMRRPTPAAEPGAARSLRCDRFAHLDRGGAREVGNGRFRAVARNGAEDGVVFDKLDACFQP